MKQNRAKYKNKYRIKSARLQGYNYGQKGAYFLTICTQNKVHYFGEIANKTMHLNALGDIANRLWLEIPDRFPYIELGAFVVMPNHTHGVLIITEETRLIASSQQDNKIKGGITSKYNPMLHDNISRVIRWYKGRCTFEMRKINSEFEWQSRFHDHIIRDARAFKNIQNYIINNPQNWKRRD